MRHTRPLSLILFALAVTGTGCGSPYDEVLGQRQDPLAVPGPWQIPADVLAIGDQNFVSYTGAGPWVGESGCSGGLTPGAIELKDFLSQAFPQIWHIGGYNCRPIRGSTTVMSVHGTGRALDLHIALDGGDADNGAGDPVGNWLIVHAQEIGIQYIIWDHLSWKADRPVGSKDRDYGGVNPHIDHLHVEISPAAADKQTDWFSGTRPLPDNPECLALPAGGGIVDEQGPCAAFFGPSQYWRFVDGAGFDGSLFWTNAFQSDTPSNWARWTLKLSEPGDYRVEVYIDPSWGVYDATRYSLVHAGSEDTLTLDQGAADGWTDLGIFSFAATGDEMLSVYDDVAGPVPSDQHIVADAVRLTRILDLDHPLPPSIWDGPPSFFDDPVPDTDPGNGSEAPEETNGGGGGARGAGCGCSGGGGGGPLALGLLVLLALRRRYST